MNLIADKIRMKRLEWLGHLARIADNRIYPKPFFLVGCLSPILDVAQKRDGEM